MKSLKKKVNYTIFILVSILGYSQYESVSKISVSISENAIMNENKIFKL